MLVKATFASRNWLNAELLLRSRYPEVLKENVNLGAAEESTAIVHKGADAVRSVRQFVPGAVLRTRPFARCSIHVPGARRSVLHSVGGALPTVPPIHLVCRDTDAECLRLRAGVAYSDGCSDVTLANSKHPTK